MLQPAPTSGTPGESLRQARARYFAANGFDEQGYADRWVRLMAGPVPIYFPNSAARVRSVRLHDLHHCLTGYATTWTGEAEIGAWEIGGGCVDHYAAWVLNLLAVAIGLVIAPHAVWQAFVRGRRGRNLYDTEFCDALLDGDVEAMRRDLGLDQPAARRPGDRRAFAGWSLLSVLSLTIVAVLPFALVVALATALATMVSPPS